MKTTAIARPEEPSLLAGVEALRLSVNNLDQPFMLVDRNLRIICTNEITRTMAFDYSGIDLRIGTCYLDLAPLEARPFLTELFQRIFDHGHDQTMESTVQIKGQALTFQSRYYPARDDQGAIVGALVVSRDVTRQRDTEETIKLAEERWRFALEGARQGVWDWNMKTGEVYFSPACRQIYELKDGQPLHHISHWELLIHPDDRLEMDHAIHQHTAGSEPNYDTKYRIITPRGNVKWIQARGMVFARDAWGSPERMIGTHTDITEMMEAEERIRRSEQQYRYLFYSNPLPCWIYDLETKNFVVVNQAAVEHYGFAREEFLARNLELIHPEEQLPLLHERYQLDLEKKDVAVNNWKHRKKNGEVIFVDLRITTIPYQGRLCRMVVSHDVTAKVLNETELRVSKERFELAARASSEALWEWDIQTGQTFMSDTYTALLGWRVNDDKRFEEWHDYIHPADRKATIDGYYKVINDPSQDRWSHEYRYLRSDGSYAIVLDKATILRDETGKAIRVVGALQDVTEQRQAEEAVRKSNERFELITRATSDAIYDWNISTNHLFWGEGLFTLFGYQPQEVPIEIWEDYVHPDDQQRIADSLTLSLENHRIHFWKEEYRFRRADGSYAFVLDRGFIIRDDRGKPARLLGSLQDISDRKYNENLLSLERTIFEMSTNPSLELRTIVQTLLKGIEAIHTDAYTSVLLLRNDQTIESLASPRLPVKFTAALNGIRIGPEEGSCGSAMSRKQTVIVSDIEHDALWKKYKDLAMGSGLRACWSLPIIHSSGEVMGSFATYYLTPKEPSSRELLTLERMRNILRVLMEHHWSLQVIKQANERFDTMMKATNDLIWDWDMRTNQVYRGEAGLRKVYGIEAGRELGDFDQWLKRIHPADRDRARNSITEILAADDGRHFEMEYRFLRDDGSYSYVYDRGMILRNEQGKPVRMIGAAQDITERKRLEAELLRNELDRQKAINQATVDTQEQERSEIGKELHDNVNQVLTTTKLYLDLALTTPEIKDELIGKSVRNIISVINEIRQLSRSLMDPSIGDLGLMDSLDDLIDNINLTRKIQVSLKRNNFDDHQLSATQKLTVFRIVQEALNNTIRHAKATNVVIEFHDRQETIELVIEDNGIGFNPAQVRKGAGLKNIENRIYLIDGKQKIISAPGEGCRLVIHFPIHTKTEQ